jgi:hypothetical protein
VCALYCAARVSGRWATGGSVGGGVLFACFGGCGLVRACAPADFRRGLKCADPSQPPQVKTPAEAAGVQVGDVLVSISDALVAYMSYDDMADVLGKAQRPAKFVFARHTLPFNPESARPENIILKQVCLR